MATINDIMRSFNLRDKYGSLLDIMPELANMTGGLGGVSPMQTGKGVLNIDNRDVFDTTKSSMSSIINSGVLNQGIGDLTPGLGQEGGRERPEQEIPKVDPSYLHNKFYDDRGASNLLDQIAEQNLKDRRFMRGVGAAKALDSASSLLHNLFEGDGLAPVESVNLVSPEVRYDDTLREKMAGEATKMSQAAQMNAMKMGAGGMIPAIQSSAMRSVNEGNIQAQAQLNQIQQQNAMWGADTANKEQEFYVTQRDKIINDALQKNIIRSQMIGQSKDALWTDLDRIRQQDQLYKEADFMSKMAREAASDPYGLADRYMKSLPGYYNITGVSDKDKDKEWWEAFKRMMGGN